MCGNDTEIRVKYFNLRQVGGNEERISITIFFLASWEEIINCGSTYDYYIVQNTQFSIRKSFKNQGSAQILGHYSQSRILESLHFFLKNLVSVRV